MAEEENATTNFVKMYGPRFADPSNPILMRRISKRWTREKLAAEAGVSFATLARVEQGHVTGSYETIRKLALALEVEVAELWRDYQENRARARRDDEREPRGNGT